MTRLLTSLVYALRGLWSILKEEPNARIHLVAAVVAVVVSLWLQVSTLELVAVCFSIVLVFVAEIVNTGIEQLANIISPAEDPRIRHIKDISAAAVLVCASAAVVIGSVIIINHID